jgi:hypothetical protein
MLMSALAAVRDHVGDLVGSDVHRSGHGLIANHSYGGPALPLRFAGLAMAFSLAVGFCSMARGLARLAEVRSPLLRPSRRLSQHR